MKDIIQQSLRESQDVLAQFLSDPSKLDAIERAADCLVDALQQGKKILYDEDKMQDINDKIEESETSANNHTEIII